MDFVGLTMLVTLSSPPGAQLRGIVKSVEPGKTLTLRNVTCPANGKYLHEFSINASDIVDLVEATNENVCLPPPAVAMPLPPLPPKKFEDPAILSVGRKPSPIRNTIQSIPTQQWTNMTREDSGRTVTSREGRPASQRPYAAVESLVEPMIQAHIAEKDAEPIPEVVVPEELSAEAEVSPEAPAAKVPKRSRRRKNQRDRLPDGLLEPATPVVKTKETTRSKGWRQTPLLEPNPSFQPFTTLRRKGRRDDNGGQSGWGTEDATDVQEAGDFNFADNLAKFDKKGVFTQLEAEDATADEDRLVSHNRLSNTKPGTASGKNLAYNENVLDTPNGTLRHDSWKADSSDASRGQREPGSRASRRGESKLPGNRRATSRKGSSTNSAQHAPPSRVLSMPVPAQKQAFYLVPSNQVCEPVSPLQMLNLENIADHDLGLTEDMMTENAGRGISEVALSALNPGAGLIQKTRSIIPTVAVFAGNNKNGIRAISAARHLRNHGLNVVVCVLGLERETELLAGLRRQLKVFRSFGGKVVTKSELMEYTKNLNAPIELIIDGLLGLTISFEELRTGDQATAYELIEFANRNKASVLAIDIPTGVDPTTGKVSIIDGRPLYIHAKFVVAMGAPKKGLLEAMSVGESEIDEDDIGQSKDWQLFVADIGLGAAVWKKAGTRVRRGTEFEGTWVLGMRFQGLSE